jgi:uridine phosphorylase
MVTWINPEPRWYVPHMPVYLSPTAPIAADAILPSDPAHALLLAQELLEAPLMSNHSHGLWGYHGETAAGPPLTIQSTGIGGPSAAIVLGELAELGVRRAVRIGACTPLDGHLEAGDAVVVERATAVGAGVAGDADTALTRRLADAARPVATGAVASVDPLLDGREPPPSEALATDLESAAVLSLAATLGVAAAAVLVVDAPSEAALKRLGLSASEALASPGGG